LTMLPADTTHTHTLTEETQGLVGDISLLTIAIVMI